MYHAISDERTKRNPRYAKFLRRLAKIAQTAPKKARNRQRYAAIATLTSRHGCCYVATNSLLKEP